MKAIFRKYNDDGETTFKKEVVASLSTGEQLIEDRLLWVEVPTECGEDEAVIEIHLHEIFEEILERLRMKLG